MSTRRSMNPKALEEMEGIEIYEECGCQSPGIHVVFEDAADVTIEIANRSMSGDPTYTIDVHIPGVLLEALCEIGAEQERDAGR